MTVALQWETPPAWAERALEEPIALLVDHAHCELGAASTAQTLIAKYPFEGPMVDQLAALAAEELRHFRRVHRLIKRLGGRLEPIRPNPYAGALVRTIDRSSESALADRLLVSALIEQRSFERFRLLGAAAERDQPLLARLFRGLEASEAGHARLFVELAQEMFPRLDVAGRLRTWGAREAALIRELPFEVRIHSGPPVPVAASARA